jgi:hypothetical protein
MNKRKDFYFSIVYILAHIALILFFFASHDAGVQDFNSLTKEYNERKQEGFDQAVSEYREHYNYLYQESYDATQEELYITMLNSLEYAEGYRAGYYHK